MNNIINFTFIIPHKNLPNLLQRCIDSIPQRDDIEIIVVDDNSSHDIVDFKNFPGSDRKDVRIIWDKKGGGAGAARNIGINFAQGKWLLFADSDDTYTENLDSFLNTYLDSDSEIVYFKSNIIDENGQQDEKNKINDYMTQYLLEKNNDKDIKFGHWPPWNKLIKRSLVIDNKIRFDEISSSNDKMFSLTLGKFVKRFEVSNIPVYNYLKRTGSITTTKSTTKFLNFFNTTLRQNSLYHEVGYKNKVFIPLILILNRKSINKWVKRKSPWIGLTKIS